MKANGPALQRYRRLRDRVAFLLDPRIDRYILERAVFPALAADAGVNTLLFAGVDWYTKDYEQRFPGRRLHTIDIDPDKARYGSSSHSTAPLGEADRFHEPASLDALVCSGVIGFGLNDRAECERTMALCRSLLRPGGWLVIGWNDVDDLRPFHVDDLEELRRFEPTPLPPFPTARYPTFSPARHTFDFYRRPAA
jgi:hypothetical protein